MKAVHLDGEALSRHKFDELGQETARQQGKLFSRYDYDPAGRLLNQQAGLQGSANPLIIQGRATASPLPDIRIVGRNAKNAPDLHD